LPPAARDVVRPLDVGLAGRVLTEGRAIRLDRYADVEQPARPDIGDHAMLGVPVVWTDRAIGFFGVGAPPPHRFTDEDVETLTLFARYAAIAIENARLFEGERRRAARIATIDRIGRLLTSSDTLQDLLQRGVETIRADLGLTDLSIALVDPDDPEMLVLGANSRDYPVAVPHGYRQSIREGIVGAAVQTRAPVLDNEVAANPRYIRGPSPSNVCAELAVPVIIGDRLVGVFNVESTIALTGEDAADLEIVAHQFGVAIENQRLLEAERRRAARVATINRIGSLLTSSLSLDQIFQTAVEAIGEYLHFANVAIMLVDPSEPQYLVLRARGGMYGSMVGEYRQHISRGIVGVAARARRRVLVNNVREDPRYIAIPGGEQIIAELAVPILVGGRLRGMLNIESEARIPEDDADGLTVIADQMGIAIENARLFGETQAALEEARLLYETSRRMSTASDPGEVVRAYLEQVATRGQYACTVALYEPDEAGERAWVDVRGRWTPDSGMALGGERIPRTHDALDPILNAGQTATISDVHDDPRVSAVLREHQREAGRPALAMIPLMVHGERIGLVILGSPVVQEWSEADLRPYQVTAGHLAAALDSRRQQILAAERNRQLAVLEERRRLARELHDSVTQSVFSVTLIAQSLASAWRRDPAEGERRVERLLNLSQSALAELRALLTELRPAAPAEQDGGVQVAVPSRVRIRRDGLAATLRTHAAGVARDGLRVEVDASGYLPQPADHEEALFRIAQEALNNAVKHAAAAAVTVRLRLDGGWCRLTVTDDGAGFSQARPQAARGKLSAGFGLIGIQERAAALGGAAHVVSAPGRGTTIDVILPRKDEPTR
jgi:signal transduction histidine kinase/putative methionine-R-sulfoxide reductase with GAF domain